MTYRKNLFNLYNEGVEHWNLYVQKFDTWANKDLSNRQMDGANFDKFYLPDISIENASLNNASFQKSICKATVFRGSQLKNANFQDAQLGGIWTRQVDPGHFYDYVTDFSSADLTNANFTNADLRKVNFQGAVLNGAVFSGANVTGADFRNAKIAEARFQNSNEDDAVFRDSDLIQSNDQHKRDNSTKNQMDNENFPNRTILAADLSPSTDVFHRSYLSHTDLEKIASWLIAESDFGSRTDHQLIEKMRSEILKIEKGIDAFSLSNLNKSHLDADLSQIKTELARETPRKKFLKIFLESLRDNLAKALGTGVAAGITAAMGALVAKYIGLI